MSCRAIVSVAGWEERFVLSSEQLLRTPGTETMLLYYYDKAAAATEAARRQVTAMCEHSGVSVHSACLSYDDPVNAWRAMAGELEALADRGQTVLVNLSTMPREALWMSFRLLEDLGAKVDYVYFKPQKYSRTWLTRDPGIPRLVLRLSGHVVPGRSTVLVVVTGYDTERVEQLRRAYEPAVTLLGVQAGLEQMNRSRNLDPHWRQFGGAPGVKLFQVDAYSPDHGEAAIQEMLGPYLNKANIVMTSIGPKLSAVALYRLQRRHPEMALAYTPSNEFNKRYSRGIGQAFFGEL